MLSGFVGPEVKYAAKAALHRSGALRAARALKARSAFTVVLFHRVLPDSDPRAKTADWNYTIKLEHFEGFLDFVRETYAIVTLKQVEEAYRNSAPLPPHSLLITFDDAWDDTARYAVPALEKRKLPSAIFVPTGGVDNDLLIWGDVAAMLSRAGALRANGATGAKDELGELQRLPAQERTEKLRAALERAGDSVAPVMMTKAQFAALPRSVELGGHSVNHIRFTELDDVRHELAGSHEALRALTGRAPRSFAFPHGSYHLHHVGQAHKAGYDLVFTTIPCANRLDNGRLTSAVLARITLSDFDMTDRKGAFSESELAYSLFDRPARTLEDAPASST